jgi:glycosyltransferase involved in cell wall biosynthesis
MQRAFENLGVPTYNLDSPGEHDPRAILRARRLITRLRPDVVHTHLLRADLFAGLAARWTRVPVVLSTQYGVGGFRREKRRRTDFLLDRLCAAIPTHVLAVAEAVKRDCVERLGMNPDDVSVIHTGIDPPEDIDATSAAALRRDWQIGDDQPLILSLARLSYEKGLDTLIDAAEIVHRKNPDARFVLLGSGPDRLGLEVRIRIKELIGVVKLGGFVDDIWPALAAADVFCMPSKSEGMPNALLEAMTSGTPIVATTAGGIPEAVEHNSSALMVDPEDPRMLASALLRMIEMKQDSRRFAEAAQRIVLERFLAGDVARRYETLYEKLLAAWANDRAESQSNAGKSEKELFADSAGII